MAAEAKVNIPTVKLNDGRKIPVLGYGTYLGASEKKENGGDEVFSFEANIDDLPKMVDALSYAIDIGYRHIDTAHFYRIEPEVGQVINQKIEEGVVKREELFVTTKVWQHFHRENDVEVSLRGSLRRLKLDYVDLLLIHWPMSMSQTGEDEKIDYLETWRGFEKVLAKSLTKSIGVSNFNGEQMKRLLANCKVKPVCNQIEINLNLGQPELVKLCQDNDVAVVAYSPFGTMIPSRAVKNTPEPKLGHPTLVALSKKYGKTATQIVLRFLYQRGIITIPKTVTRSRVLENASIFDFEIDAADFKVLQAFDVNFRTVRPSFYQNHLNYPFEIEDIEVPPVPAYQLVWKNGKNLNID